MPPRDDTLITATLNRGALLTSPTDARNAIVARLRDQKHEVLAVVFLTNRHQVIAYEEIARGTFDGTVAYAREVAKRCLDLNAAAIIIAHHHPSGVAEPTESDRAITTRIDNALKLTGVRVVDHFVIRDGNVGVVRGTRLTVKHRATVVAVDEKRRRTPS